MFRIIGVINFKLLVPFDKNLTFAAQLHEARSHQLNLHSSEHILDGPKLISAETKGKKS